MATLEQDLYNAFAKATVGQQTEQGKTVQEQTSDDGNIKELSKDIATSIIDWMLKQTFTITEMKATTELENFKTMAAGAIKGKVMPGIPTATGGPTIAMGTNLADPIDLSKGMMMTFGHSYVGRPAMRVKDADTSDEWNDYTKVKLDPYKLKDQGTQQYPVDDRDIEEEEEAVELKPPEAKFVEDQFFGLWVELDDISIPGDGLLDSSQNVWTITLADGDDIKYGVAPLQYTFTTSGTYPVKLTVTDTNGLSHEYEKDVTVTDFESPIASFNTTVNDLFVFFTDTSIPGEGVIMSWLWSFSDDNDDSSLSPHPTYGYSESGTYTVTLTVTDQYGKTDTYDEQVSVG